MIARMGILPPRPLKIAESHLAVRRRTARGLTVVVVLAGAGFSVGSWWFGREVLRERKVWREGQEGRVLSMSGQVNTESWVFIDMSYEYDLKVVYADVAGVQHAANVKFDTFWKQVDSSRPAGLRYLAADFDHPVLSYAIEAGFTRWVMPLLMGACALFMLVVGPTMPRFHARKEAALRLAAEDGEELLLPLVSATPFKKAWTVFYEPSPGVKVRDSLPEEPLIVVRDGKKYVVALRSPRGGKPVLMGAELLAFELGLAERNAIAERLRG
jgi:hypothetical protein